MSAKTRAARAELSVLRRQENMPGWAGKYNSPLYRLVRRRRGRQQPVQLTSQVEVADNGRTR
jgi:hypothetical protein